MDKLPKLSIITVVKNDRNGLAETVRSVRSQTFQDFEHLIIDGDSTDGTAEWLKKLNPQADYWISEPDKGTYFAMNKGLKQIRGEWVYFLNAGDYLSDDDALEQLIPHLTAQRHLVYWDVWRKNETGERKIWKQKRLFHNGLFNNICHQAMWYHWKLLKPFQFDTRFKIAADANLLLELLGSYSPLQYFRLSKPLAVFLDGGISSKFAVQALEEREQAFQNWNVSRPVKWLNQLNLKRQQRKLLNQKSTLIDQSKHGR